MSEGKQVKQTRRILPFNDKVGPLPISRLDRALMILITGFIVVVVAHTILSQSAVPYLILRALHYHLSRLSLALAGVMFAIALYIGVIKHADVTPYFRRGTLVIVGTMALESLIGGILYIFIGARPYEDVHLIYGGASILALPFFMFVEMTAEKRPAMSSYIWGFAILAGIIFRSIDTGAL